MSERGKGLTIEYTKSWNCIPRSPLGCVVSPVCQQPWANLQWTIDTKHNSNPTIPERIHASRTSSAWLWQTVGWTSSPNPVCSAFLWTLAGWTQCSRFRVKCQYKTPVCKLVQRRKPTILSGFQSMWTVQGIYTHKIAFVFPLKVSGKEIWTTKKLFSLVNAGHIYWSLSGLRTVWNCIDLTRDLAENWNINIAHELKDYLDELNSITYSVDGVGNLKFAEGALILLVLILQRPC